MCAFRTIPVGSFRESESKLAFTVLVASRQDIDEQPYQFQWKKAFWHLSRIFLLWGKNVGYALASLRMHIVHLVCFRDHKRNMLIMRWIVAHWNSAHMAHLYQQGRGLYWVMKGTPCDEILRNWLASYVFGDFEKSHEKCVNFSYFLLEFHWL